MKVIQNVGRKFKYCGPFNSYMNQVGILFLAIIKFQFRMQLFLKMRLIERFLINVVISYHFAFWVPDRSTKIKVGYPINKLSICSLNYIIYKMHIDQVIND